MAIDVAVEEVADNLEEIAAATRRINTTSLSWFLGGVAVGAAVGFYFGYRFNKEKIKAEAFKQSQEELNDLREMYQRRVADAEKRSLEEIIEERGYKVEEEIPESPRPLPAPVPGIRDPRTAAPPVVTYDGGKDANRGWNFAEELKGRLEGEPYVIHQEEFREGQVGYNQTTYTFYAADEVLVDEDNRPLPHADLIVGPNNLKWGHGSDDIDVVFVRNDRLELDMEITRSDQSYEREVLGLEQDETDDD